MGAEGVEAAVAWLSSQAEVVDLQFGSGSVRFRIEGGRPEWITDEPALFPAPEVLLPAQKSVAGEDLNSDGVRNNRDRRRALVLNAAYNDFPEIPETGFLAGLFDVPGYERDIVQVVERDATVSAFGNWDEFDVVYIVAHGLRVCEDYLTQTTLPVCPTALLTGESSDFDSPAFPDVPGIEAVNYVGSAGNGTFSEARVGIAVGADYFRHVYPNKLDHTVVVINACRAGDGDARDDVAVEPELLQALRGDDTVVFAWSDIAWLDDVRAMSDALIEVLAQGRTTIDAMAEMAVRGVTQFENDYFRENRTVHTDLIAWGALTDSIRIREVVEIVDHDGHPLTDGSGFDPWISTTPGDGQNDRIALFVRLYGLSEADLGSSRLQFKLDGASIGSPVTPTNAEPLPSRGPYAWSLRVPNIDTGRELARETRYELEAILELPEGGESRFATDVTILGCGFTVTLDGNEVTGQSGDEVQFWSAGSLDGKLVSVTVVQVATGLTTIVVPAYGDEVPKVLGPGTFLGDAGGYIAKRSDDVSYGADGSSDLIIFEYEPGVSVRGAWSGPVIVLGPAPDYPLRDGTLEFTFEAQVPPDLENSFGISSCTIP
jgi:hypothetical protein